MKKVLLVGGTMGVGKTTVCQRLKMKLDKCVFLDGDWCWDAHPFTVTDETKRMVLDNIVCLLNNFIRCSAYDNIIFCWVMHEQSLIDAISGRLDAAGCEVIKVSLICTEAALRERLELDVANGIRQADVIERSAARIAMYEKLDTVKVDTTGRTSDDIAEELARM